MSNPTGVPGQDPDFTEAWPPEPGDKIAGTIVEINERDAGWDPYPVVTLQVEDNQVAIHAFHTVLQRELAKVRPEVGDAISVAYRGKKTSGSGTTYHAYKSSSDRSVPGVD